MLRVLVLSLLIASSARAGGFGIPDIGVRRTAMAAVIGRPDESAAIYHNPAGLGLQRGWHVYLSSGLFLVRTELQLAAWDGSERFLGASPGPDGYYAPIRPRRAMGVVPMLALTGALTERLAVGAAAYLGNGVGAGFDPDGVTRYHMIDGYIVAPQAVLAASYQIADSLALGASAGIVNVRVHRHSEVFPIQGGMDVSAITGTRPDLVLDGSGWAPTWMAGAFGRPHPRVTWGATVTGRVDATLAGPISITYSDDAGSPGDTLVGRQRTHHMLPWAVMAGANVDVTPHVEVGAEARYWLYRQYRVQHTDVDGIAFLRELDTMKNYHDSWQVSGGIRVHDLAALRGLELMSGVHSDHTPAPTSTVSLDQPTFDHVGLHAGARWTVGRYRLGASYLHYWYQLPTVTDSMTGPPSNFRGHGANHIVTASVELAL